MPTSTGIVVDISLWRTAAWAYGISGNRLPTAGFDRFEVFAVLGFVLFKQQDIVHMLCLFDDRELVHGKLVVLRT